MAKDRVIDIRRYLEEVSGRQEPGAFAVWGAADRRPRFALPLWRAIFLMGGDWGGIVSLPKSQREDSPDPLFVLDLKQDPARTASSPEVLHLLAGKEAPALAVTDRGELGVFLGEDESRLWFLQVAGASPGRVPEGPERETLLFLAGECAGLIFFRSLATLPPSSASAP